MDKNNVELFKQAINEGLSNKFDSVANGYTDRIVCSEKHSIAMRTIVYGKTDTKKVWSPRMKRVVAILVAIAILLTSCGFIFRNEIRDFVENVYEFFVTITYTEEDSEGNRLKDIYDLTYIPKGYHLEENTISPASIRYKFVNSNGDIIWFVQSVLDGTYFVIDVENGYTQIKNIKGYDVYYRYTDQSNIYIWNNGEYTIRIKSTVELPIDELILIIDGIVVK